jgi:DNA-directed RNA polymerase specialized sigma subunit
MALSEYDIHRIASEVVRKLVEDQRFIKAMQKMLPKQERLVNSSQAARMLGISRYTVCRIAEQLGGIRKDSGTPGKGHWMFPEQGLAERFKQL